MWFFFQDILDVQQVFEENVFARKNHHSLKCQLKFELCNSFKLHEHLELYHKLGIILLPYW